MASCWDVHTFVVPVLGHERGLSASLIGTILGAFAVAAAVVRVLIPVIAANLREGAVVTGSMAITAVLFGVYPLMHSAIGMAICSVLLGLALGCVQPMVMSTLHQITPEHRHGQAVAVRMMSINASSVAMPLLFGAAGSVIGIAGVFWTVAAVAASGTRTAFRLRGDSQSR
jgi:MFS family permease